MKPLDSGEQTGNVSWDVFSSRSVNSDLFGIWWRGVPIRGGEVCAHRRLRQDKGSDCVRGLLLHSQIATCNKHLHCHDEQVGQINLISKRNVKLQRVSLRLCAGIIIKATPRFPTGHKRSTKNFNLLTCNIFFQFCLACVTVSRPLSV